jgi:hypothetical protein
MRMIDLLPQSFSEVAAAVILGILFYSFLVLIFSING